MPEMIHRLDESDIGFTDEDKTFVLTIGRLADEVVCPTFDFTVFAKCDKESTRTYLNRLEQLCHKALSSLSGNIHRNYEA